MQAPSSPHCEIWCNPIPFNQTWAQAHVYTHIHIHVMLNLEYTLCQNNATLQFSILQQSRRMFIILFILVLASLMAVSKYLPL